MVVICGDPPSSLSSSLFLKAKKDNQKNLAAAFPAWFTKQSIADFWSVRGPEDSGDATPKIFRNVIAVNLYAENARPYP